MLSVWLKEYINLLTPAMIKSNQKFDSLKDKMNENYLQHWMHFEAVPLQTE